jgi:AcrR family transcriptional regulator
MDRRVRKTQRSLHEALIALIREKDYDDIAVQDILNRANVGRSTFYTHYRDKDELLTTGIQEMVRAVPSAPRTPFTSKRDQLTWFSLPILEHHDQHRRTGEARMGRKARVVLHEHLRRVIAELLRDEFRKSATASPKTAALMPTDLLVQYISSTFILVLNWWLETRSTLRATEVNRLFCSLIAPALPRD